MPRAKTCADSAKDAETPPSASEVLEQVRKILGSGVLGESRRLADLLGYLVSRTMEGNGRRLKEYAIATEALGRDVTFDPRVSAAVRVQANRLRQRLREYFLGMGRHDPVRIELRPGSYVLSFSRNESGQQGGDEQAVSESSPPLTWSPGTPRPSLTILPFVHIGESCQFKFMAHAFTEELIANLAVTHWLRVRTGARTASGGKRPKWRASRDMPPDYAIDGSVLEVGDRVRAFCQLTDVETGNVLSAHRQVLCLKDVLAGMSKAAQAAALAVVRAVATSERVRAASLSTDNLDAWSLYQRGNHHLYRFGKQDLQRARSCFRKAAAADPSFASPCGAIAYTGFLDFVLGFDVARRRVTDDAIEAGRTAVARDDHDPMAHFGLARALSLTGALESTMTELQAAIELDPHFGPAHLGVGAVLSLAGRHREAIGALDTAIRLSPRDPSLWTMENVRALAHLELGEFDAAVQFGRRACAHANTVPWAHLTLMSALSNMSRDEEADSIRLTVHKRWPDFSLQRFMEGNPFDIEMTPRWHRGIHDVWGT